MPETNEFICTNCDNKTVQTGQPSPYDGSDVGIDEELIIRDYEPLDCIYCGAVGIDHLIHKDDYK